MKKFKPYRKYLAYVVNMLENLIMNDYVENLSLNMLVVDIFVDISIKMFDFFLYKFVW